MLFYSGYVKYQKPSSIHPSMNPSICPFVHPTRIFECSLVTMLVPESPINKELISLLLSTELLCNPINILKP